MENKKFIWITTQFEGFHKYPRAPDEVKFLRNLHRHIFHIKIWLEVKHNNRDVEFIMFKRWVDKVIDEFIIDEHMSCEMISDKLYGIMSKTYPKREIRIDVSEDGENGSYSEYK